MLTKSYMIDDISSSQGFVSRVEHKTRQVTAPFTLYVIARCDGLPADDRALPPLVTKYLHLTYQPYMYPPHGKPDQLVLELENQPYTAYARAVLSAGVTMTLDEAEYFCYAVKSIGIPDEEMLYDFMIDERRAMATGHLKIKIYGLPLHLWTIRAVERVLQLHCIVEDVNPANRSFRKLRSISCTAWAIKTLVPFPWYILIHVSNKYDKERHADGMHRSTETFCIGIDRTSIEGFQHPSLGKSEKKIPSFLQALQRGMVSHSYLNEVDIPADQMEFLKSSFLLTSCDQNQPPTEDKLTLCLQQMQFPCSRQIIAKQVDKFRYLIHFKGPMGTTLFQTLSAENIETQLPVGKFLVQKWTTSIGAASSMLSRMNDIRITGLPTEFYSPAIIEDILSPHCISENSSHQLDDSPDVLFYNCAIWTHESRNIPKIITVWAAPDGLVVEPYPFKRLQLPLQIYYADITQQ